MALEIPVLPSEDRSGEPVDLGLTFPAALETYKGGTGTGGLAVDDAVPAPRTREEHSNGPPN